MTIIDISQSAEIFTVSRLNRDVRFVLESNFPMLWVEGEISNFAAPHSGHWYFSLKDAGAQVKCAMFRPQNRYLGFTPRDGMHVMLKAKISLYEGRGDFQLIAEHLEEMGEGRLRLAYEALKKRLNEAGLFNNDHKKLIPSFPNAIGIVTSATGAAVKDVLSVLKRRFPLIPVTIYPTLVQGDIAARNIVNALERANQDNTCDVLILTRGGGSLEDLWPFNEEIVANAIYASTIPIISGVGHEVDFTIADFVADLRAPTPSAAAELATPDQLEMLNALQKREQQLTHHTQQALREMNQQIVWLQKQLMQQHPKRKLADQSQQLDYCEMSLMRLQTKFLTKLQHQLNATELTLLNLNPINHVRELNQKLNYQTHQFKQLMLSILQTKQHALASFATQLDQLSPLATLKRGYAVVTKNNHVIKQSQLLVENDEIEVRLDSGKLDCVVKKIFASSSTTL
jgi:exodeoxyribonuclease VII large subunit